MPAIQLPRLRRQAAELVEHFSQPRVFIREMEDMFEFYSDHTRRPIKVGAPPPLIPAYRVPEPVLRRILFELSPRAKVEPEKAFALADALWQVPKLEFRQLAAHLLGKIPSAEPVQTYELLSSWNTENQEETLLKIMADEGLEYQRIENTDALIEQLEIWMTSESLQDQKLALRALQALLDKSHYDNAPAIFDLLELRFTGIPKQMRPYFLDVLNPLAKRFPQEAAYFLRKQLEAAGSDPSIPRLVRRASEFFPPDKQVRLKKALTG